MKVIINNVLTSVTASSEDSSYPATNLTDERPKLVWRANGVDSAVLTCNNTGDFNTVVLFNTNADSATAAISDPNGITFDGVTWDGVDWVQGDVILTGEFFQSGNSGILWLDLPETVSNTLNVAISLAAATGTVVEAGVVCMGVPTEFTDPRYGIGQELIDYSISREASNGSEYYKARDRVRVFTCDFLADRSSQDSEYYTFMNDLARDVGRIPLVWRIVDNTNTEWVVYGRLADMPTSTHAYPNHAPISFSIKEVL